VYNVANDTCFTCNSTSTGLDKKETSYPGTPTVGLQLKQVPFATIYTQPPDDGPHMGPKH
jgi:hypothetical protein